MKKYIQVYSRLITCNKNTIAIALLILCSSGFSFVIPLLNGVVINQLLSKNKLLFLELIFIVLVIHILLSICNYQAEKLIKKTQVDLINSFKFRLLEASATSTLDFREKISPSEYQSRFNEINSISILVSSVIYKLILSLIIMIFILIYIFLFSKFIFLVVLLVIPLYYALNIRNFNKINSSTKLSMNSNVEMSRVINSIYGKFDYISSYILGNKCIEEVKKTIEENTDIQGKLQNEINLTTNGITLLNNVLVLLVSLMVGIMVINGNATVGQYITLTQYIIYIFTPLTMLSTVNLSLQPGMVAYTRTTEFIKQFEKNKYTNGVNNLKDIESIEIKSPQFKDRISQEYAYSAVRGDHIYICGPNGSGKSTLLKLLNNSYENIDSGLIRINKKDIKFYTRESVRKNIHYCSQEVCLFSYTVLENIMAEVPNHLRDEYLLNLRNDPETNELLASLELGKLVDECASNLSLGEQKKIALLRLAITSKEIILVDELDASLDYTGKLILKQIMEKKTDSIVFEISHIYNQGGD